MSGRRIELDEASFAAAVPFGFVTDTGGTVQSVGDALHRRLQMKAGQQMSDLFKVLRPLRARSFQDLPVDASSPVVLRALHTTLDLKGSLVRVNGSDNIAFFGSAVVRDISDFQQRGLQISDFPPSDATPDLLLSMQATRSALSDARKLSADLETALSQANAATDAKARFLAVMSHEIRTPLNGMGPMIDLLRESTLDEEQIECLDTMDRCSRSLLALVNDILDFSKLEANKVRILRDPINLPELVTRSVEHFRAAARERKIKLELLIDDCPTWVSADNERVRQVIANLIGNAIKFTLVGGIRVNAYRSKDEMVVVDVIDSGVGIPEEYREALFDPFVQADSSATRKFGGTGLGLSISRELARAMQGDVALIEGGGDGTQFRFSLLAPDCLAPREHAANSSNAAQETTPYGHISVLVAEDDPTNQLIAKKMLRKLGVTCTVVPDGVAAVTAAQDQHYDLILMDLMMPHMNGMQATECIRTGGGPCREAPIIAFSAATLECDRSAASKAGMSGFIEKPARLNALREALNHYLPAAE